MILKLTHKVSRDIVTIDNHNNSGDIDINSDNKILKDGFEDYFSLHEQHKYNEDMKQYEKDKSVNKTSDEYLLEVFIPQYSEYYNIEVKE